MQIIAVYWSDIIFSRIRQVAPVAQERAAITLERIPSSLVVFCFLVFRFSFYGQSYCPFVRPVAVSIGCAVCYLQWKILINCLIDWFIDWLIDWYVFISLVGLALYSRSWVWQLLINEFNTMVNRIRKDGYRRKTYMRRACSSIFLSTTNSWFSCSTTVTSTMTGG